MGLGYVTDYSLCVCVCVCVFIHFFGVYLFSASTPHNLEDGVICFKFLVLKQLISLTADTNGVVKITEPTAVTELS